MSVSGNRKVKPEKWKKVKIAVTHYGDTRAECSCGWVYSHLRAEVRRRAVERHLNKRHGGAGLRLQ